MSEAAGAGALPLTIAYILGSSDGGTGRHVAMLADGCAALGAAVAVHAPEAVGARFFPGADRPAGPAGAGGGRVAFVSVDIADRPRPLHDAAAVSRLRRLLRTAPPDVVHAHGLRAGALAAMALAGPGRGQRAAVRRPALVVTAHNAPPARARAAAVYRVLERVVARKADAVTWVSGDLAARMTRLGARAGGRALVPAPPQPPPSRGDVAAMRAGLAAGGRPLVLAAGRLVPQKGFATLISAAARWRDSAPASVLALAGDGPLGEALRGQAAREGADVRFLGRRDDMPALLAAADVVVVPSLWEGQPLLVQEALRAGRPLVASRAGGIPDLTGDDGAILVPPGDPGALAAAVLAVLGDGGLAARLSAAALDRAGALPTPDAAVGAVTALYRSLLDGPGRAALMSHRR